MITVNAAKEKMFPLTQQLFCAEDINDVVDPIHVICEDIVDPLVEAKARGCVDEKDLEEITDILRNALKFIRDDLGGVPSSSLWDDLLMDINHIDNTITNFWLEV